MSKRYFTAHLRPSVIRAFCLGMIAGAFLTGGLLTAARAAADNDSIDPALIKIAVKAEPFICRELAETPTVGNLSAVMQAVATVDHLTGYDTGIVTALAVSDGCPQFIPVLDRFIAIYAPDAGRTL